MWLVEDWRTAHRWWSIWVAIFWSGFGGLLIFLPALQDMMPKWAFGLLCVGMSVTFGLARLAKQPGTE